MTVAQSGERYRKLPGHWRGIWHGASVWMGSDHLLSVRSLRFREEYKRFHLRDVQAIVVARRPRFHISTRAIGIGALWLVAYPMARFSAPGLAAWWLAGAALVATWIYVSAARSCTCRIHTAVSRDDLPSVYRTWTARRFLAEVEPRIFEVQGVLEGNWAEAVEYRDIGAAAEAVRGPASENRVHHRGPPARSRTAVSDVFVASLFAGALGDFLTLHSLTMTARWILACLLLVQVGGAILVFVQHYRGLLRSGMQRLAIAALAVIGVTYYAGAMVAAVAGTGKMVPVYTNAEVSLPGFVRLREFSAGAGLLLGLAGAAISLRPANGEEPVS